MKLGLNLMGFVTSDLDMKVLMSRIDEDGSGIIDLEEFMDFCAATAEEDVGTICRKIRHRLSDRYEEVMVIFAENDKDNSGTIDAHELIGVMKDELDIGITEVEANTLISRFDMDEDGTISSEEFGLFLKGDFAVDKQELAVKLKTQFQRCEENGVSIVKLFTEVRI